MLAAYPMDALVSGTDFVIYRIWSSPTQPGPYSEMRVGRITAADLAQWLSTGPGPRVHSVHTFRSYFPYSASLRSEEVQNTLDTLDTTFQEGFVGMVTMMVIGYSRPRTRRRNAASARRSA